MTTRFGTYHNTFCMPINPYSSNLYDMLHFSEQTSFFTLRNVFFVYKAIKLHLVRQKTVHFLLGWKKFNALEPIVQPLQKANCMWEQTLQLDTPLVSKLILSLVNKRRYFITLQKWSHSLIACSSRFLLLSCNDGCSFGI